MNIFTVYNLDTGEIEYSTSTAAKINEVGLVGRQGILEGDYQPNAYKIVDGEAVTRTDNALEILRSKRDELLSESDWTQVADSPLSDSKKAEWATYRQTLRDFPATNSDATDFDALVWPTPPS